MKHKWLENIDVSSYPDNHFRVKSIKEFIQHIKYIIKKRKTGVDSRDCWSLDTWYYEWLYEHIKQYIHDAKDIVDLEYNKFEYDNREYTQLELMNLLCQELIRIIKWDEFEGVPDINYDLTVIKDNKDTVYKSNMTEEQSKQFEQAVKENFKKKEELKLKIFDIWKLLIDAMWW